MMEKTGFCLKINNMLEKVKEFDVKSMINFVDFVAKVLDKNYELVLALYKEETNGWSIVSIYNGYVSGRNLGDCILSEGISAIESDLFLYSDSLINYEAYTTNGNHLLCSSMLIKDDSGLPQALFSINRLIGLKSSSSEKDISNVVKLICPNNQMQMSCDSGKLIEKECAKIVEREFGDCQTPELLSCMQRKRAIKELQNRGIFQMKNAINVTANFFHLSEPTIYRYLQKAKSDRIIPV